MLISEGQAEGTRTKRPGTTTLRIEEELKKISVKDHDELYGALSDLDVDLGLSVPLFELSWAHIIDSRYGGLLEYAMFYERLNVAIDRHEPDVLVCDSTVGPGYSAVVLDVGQSRSIPVETPKSGHSLKRRIRRVLVNSVLVLPFLLDSLASLVITRFVGHTPETDTIIVPALLRLDSILPILERQPIDFDVVVASMASSWVWKLWHSDLDQFDPVPVSAFTSIGCLSNQLRIYWEVTRATLLCDAFKNELCKAIDDQLDAQFERTVEYVLTETFRTRMFTSMFLQPLFDATFRSGDVERVVIGSLSPAGRTIISTAIANDVDVYHVPHSIATGYAPNPPPELTQFASGKLEVAYYEETKQVRHGWDMVVTGRPYLTELYRKIGADSAPRRSQDGEIQLLVATQPFVQSHSFVSSVVSAVEDAQFDASVVLKVHPSESRQDYSTFADREGVTTADSSLYDLIDESDLTVTINSNVGLESVIAGTPCVCVNRWSPILLTPPYARACEGIPVLESDDELRRFFTRLSRDRIDEMRVDQHEFVHENYVLTEDAADNIAQYFSSVATSK